MKILFRSDASVPVGTGHWMRALALAQAHRDAGGDVAFAYCEALESLEKRASAEGELRKLAAESGTAEDAQATARSARECGAEWVVIDGYQFGTDYQKRIRDAGLKLLAIDDYGHAGHYAADIIINQNAYANETLYRDCESHCRTLLGSRYVILRREFRQAADWRREIPDLGRKVLVTFGGSDEDNLALRTLEGVKASGSEGLEITVILGASNPHAESISRCAGSLGFPVKVVRDASDMPALMQWADLAVSGSGTTSWEMAFMGLPAAVVVLADNQKPVAASLAEAGSAVDLGWYEGVSGDRIARAVNGLLRDRAARQKMSEAGRLLVDGEGTRRALEEMHGRLRMRKMHAADCRLAWEWANEAAVREVSFHPGAIPFEEHVRWFDAKLKDGNCFFYIAEGAGGEPVGHIRFDIRGGEAVVSLTVAKEFRGQGYGSEMLRLGCGMASRDAGTRSIHAYVLPANQASKSLFLNAGFRDAGPVVMEGRESLHYVLEEVHGTR